MLTFAEIQSPESRVIVQRSAQKQRWWKIVNTLLRWPGNDWNNSFAQLFLLISSVSNYRAVSDMCEECDTCHDRTGRPVVAGQSNPLFVPSVMKTHILLTDDLAQEQALLLRYQERIEKLSQQDRVSEFCTDAGFLKTVEVGQYFMTKDTEEVSQFTDSVACREYTLSRDKDSSEPKGWIRGNTKIGPVSEVTTCCLQGKYGVEIRIKSVNKDNSHSWVRISHGLNELVTNLNNKKQDDNEQETSEMQFEDYALKSNVRAFASRSKAKAKPQRRISASSSTKTLPIGERTWTDVEPGEYSISDYSVSKKLINLLRQGGLPREDDGAIEFWKLKRLSAEPFCAFSTLVWWNVEEHHGKRRRKQEQISVLYSSSRSFRTQSYLSFHYRTMYQFRTISSSTFIILDVQSVCTPSQILDWYREGKIQAGKDRQYSLRLWIPWTRNTKIRTSLTWPNPRLASFKQKKWKRHQDAVYWVDI